ncbi:MAG TPA: T9SS type A sorting domain-containing protein [Saprospiraceae bacterium]|nr:T9SS type A sorting domain-containing protein [Saprospiraceae bacterium]HNT19596.1 T9SS type A sorting domain-containing protein [Saprospiraceae bacterium]
MRAIWTILLCISLLDLRGQRIAKISFPSAAGVARQDGFTIQYIIGDRVAGYAALEGDARMFVGFLDPVFSSISTSVTAERMERIQVFPNPFKEQISIRHSLTGAGLRYRLTDLHGRILLQGSDRKWDMTFPTAHLAPGIYILSLEQAKGHFALYKLIKI